MLLRVIILATNGGDAGWWVDGKGLWETLKGLWGYGDWRGVMCVYQRLLLSVLLSTCEYKVAEESYPNKQTSTVCLRKSDLQNHCES